MLSPAREFYLYTEWWQGWVTETSLCSGNWNPDSSTSSQICETLKLSIRAWQMHRHRPDGSGAVLAGEKSVCGVYQVIVITFINTPWEWYVQPVQLSLWRHIPVHQVHTLVSQHGTGMRAAKLMFYRSFFVVCGVWLTRTQTHICQCVIREQSHGGGELLKVSCGDTSGSNLWPFTSPLSYGTKLSLVTEVNIRSSASTHTLPVDLQH